MEIGEDPNGCTIILSVFQCGSNVADVLSFIKIAKAFAKLFRQLTRQVQEHLR